MLASRNRPSPLLCTLTLILILLFYHSSNANSIYQHWSTTLDERPVHIPANSTLGFGAVVVISKEGSDRRHALLQSANVTDVDLTIPKQPTWTEGDLQRFINGQENAQRGSILAWLGHRNALQWYAIMLCTLWRIADLCAQVPRLWTRDRPRPGRRC